MAGLLSIVLLSGWFIAAVWLARGLTSRLKNGPLRVALMIPAVLVLVALPLADEIIGGFQFRALCKKNSVLKIDAERIKGKTIRVVAEPIEGDRDVDNSSIRIYYSRFSYRDVDSGEELATYTRYVAVSGWLVRTLAMGNSFPPLTIQPSTCKPNNVGDLSKQFDFKFTLNRK